MENLQYREFHFRLNIFTSIKLSLKWWIVICYLHSCHVAITRALFFSPGVNNKRSMVSHSLHNRKPILGRKHYPIYIIYIGDISYNIYIYIHIYSYLCFPSFKSRLWETTVKTWLSGYCFNRTTFLISALQLAYHTIYQHRRIFLYIYTRHPLKRRCRRVGGIFVTGGLEVVKMTTCSAVGGVALIGMAAFPLQGQWICTMTSRTISWTPVLDTFNIPCVLLFLCIRLSIF